MQFQSAIHSLGNTVTPFLVRSFLVNVYSPSSPSPSDSSTLGINGSTISPPSAAERRDGATLECVSYAYVAVGLVALLTAVPAAAVYIYRGAPHPLLTTPRCRSIDSQRRRSGDLSATTHVDSRPDHNYQTSVAPSQSRRLTTFLFATLLFLIGLCFGANDLMPRSYVTSFVIRQLSWAADEASLLLAVFGASMTVGRLIGVPLIVHISPGRLLIGDVALTTTGLLALLVAGCRPSVPVAVVWIGVALIGLGMATVAVTVTLELFDGKCDNLIGLPAVSALINASSATGAATAATVAGYLLEAWTPLSVIYLTAASLAGLCVLLGVRQLVVRRLQETFVSTAAVVVVVEPSSDADDESLPLLRSSCNQRLLTTESG
jgi:fucose permease